jgi:hypothetical protein
MQRATGRRRASINKEPVAHVVNFLEIVTFVAIREDRAVGAHCSGARVAEVRERQPMFAAALLLLRVQLRAQLVQLLVRFIHERAATKRTAQSQTAGALATMDGR